jgi:hypothetical protein
MGYTFIGHQNPLFSCFLLAVLKGITNCPLRSKKYIFMQRALQTADVNKLIEMHHG